MRINSAWTIQNKGTVNIIEMNHAVQTLPRDNTCLDMTWLRKKSLTDSFSIDSICGLLEADFEFQRPRHPEMAIAGLHRFVRKLVLNLFQYDKVFENYGPRNSIPFCTPCLYNLPDLNVRAGEIMDNKEAVLEGFCMIITKLKN